MRSSSSEIFFCHHSASPGIYSLYLSCSDHVQRCCVRRADLRASLHFRLLFTSLTRLMGFSILILRCDYIDHCLTRKTRSSSFNAKCLINSPVLLWSNSVLLPLQSVSEPFSPQMLPSAVDHGIPSVWSSWSSHHCGLYTRIIHCLFPYIESIVSYISTRVCSFLIMILSMVVRTPSADTDSSIDHEFQMYQKWRCNHPFSPPQILFMNQKTLLYAFTKPPWKRKTFLFSLHFIYLFIAHIFQRSEILIVLAWRIWRSGMDGQHSFCGLRPENCPSPDSLPFGRSL